MTEKQSVSEKLIINTNSNKIDLIDLGADVQSDNLDVDIKINQLKKENQDLSEKLIKMSGSSEDVLIALKTTVGDDTIAEEYLKNSLNLDDFNNIV